MRIFKSTLLAFLAIFVLGSMFCLQGAEARPHITFHVEHVKLMAPGRAAVIGYFDNTGDRTAYAKSIQYDLTVTRPSGGVIYQNSSLHNNTNVKVAPHQKVRHTFQIRDSHIPKYTQRYHWHIGNVRTHWHTNK
ncbi:hypothetical protein SAMN02910356_02119 [Selenomonas sp. GACV-9]|uniref:hypothetical protein n=1 Tax=Selenomonas sp. GACV-9 TaxID=3158782 RepID=UPI0008E1A30C|nr:hypothetical protein SAMN02910356_02119 [Selenomonas ruminantium]